MTAAVYIIGLVVIAQAYVSYALLRRVRRLERR